MARLQLEMLQLCTMPASLGAGNAHAAWLGLQPWTSPELIQPARLAVAWCHQRLSAPICCPQDLERLLKEQAEADRWHRWPWGVGLRCLVARRLVWGRDFDAAENVAAWASTGDEWRWCHLPCCTTRRKPLNRRFIVVEGIYANTGELAPIDGIKALKEVRIGGDGCMRGGPSKCSG